MNHNCILEEWKTLTTVRLLPLQVNQGILRYSKIIINNREQYMYDRAKHLKYAFCRACNVTYNHGTLHGEIN